MRNATEVQANISDSDLLNLANPENLQSTPVGVDEAVGVDGAELLNPQAIPETLDAFQEQFIQNLQDMANVTQILLAEIRGVRAELEASQVKNTELLARLTSDEEKIKKLTETVMPDGNEGLIKKLKEKVLPDGLEGAWKETEKGLLHYAAEFLKVGPQYKIVQMVVMVAEQENKKITKLLKQLREGKSSLTLAQKVGIISSITAILVGTTALFIGLFINPLLIQPLTPAAGAAIALAGTFIMDRTTRSMKDNDNPKFANQRGILERAGSTAYAAFTAPGRALSWGYEKCRGSAKPTGSKDSSLNDPLNPPRPESPKP